MAYEELKTPGSDGAAVAIIGMAFEFPQGATSEESFWEMICAGRSASTDFPPDRLSINAFHEARDEHASTGMFTARGGHFLEENLSAFDAPFFSITPNEAACMDPQHRRMLETAYHALEDAGITLDQCAGTDTSVYTGCFTNDYASILQQDYEAEKKHAALGAVPTMLANRLSWFFNFHGTSLNIDTACSSSLVALHLACQDLRSGTSSMALVGGANLIFHPNFMRFMSDFNFLSPDSRSWSFDNRGNGYARGEGLAIIVLKRLHDALRDGDTIRAVVRGTGSNQDGRTPGITQPSGEAQLELIRRTYGEANISMQPTRFFEAHGTGTATGDPIEGNAIGAAFREYRTNDDPLYIGAVKANIGHLEGCSGLAGLIKTILVLESGYIPPLAGFETLNDAIDAQELHLHFPRKAVVWPDAEIRRACINSFGFGGTNALAILDDAHNYLRLAGMEGHHRTGHKSSLDAHRFAGKVVERMYPLFASEHHATTSSKLPAEPHKHVEKINGIVPVKDCPDRMKHVISNENFFNKSAKSTASLLVSSAPDQRGATRLTDAYQEYITTAYKTGCGLDDLVYSLAVRKSSFCWRSFAVVRNGCETKTSAPRVQFSAPLKTTPNPRIVFVFTGQGAQYLGMGRELMSVPVFRASLEQCESCLQELGCPWSLVDLIEGASPDGFDIESPMYSQSLTSCLQIALVDLFRSIDITPSFVIGHSSGEIAAAYASGAVSRYSAVRVAYHRGLLSSRLAAESVGLTMMAVGLSRESVGAYLDKLTNSEVALKVQIGCVNSQKSITLTGDEQQLSTLEGWFRDRGIFCRKLRVPIAYHSGFMDSISEDYAQAIQDLEIGRNAEFVPMVSTVTGDIVDATELKSAGYWTRNLISTVEFDTAVCKLLTYVNREPKRRLGGKRRAAVGGSRGTYLLELGPHRALQGPITDILQQSGNIESSTKYLASLIRGEDAYVAFLNTVGALHCHGFPVDVLAAQGLDRSRRPTVPGLPTYPFNHEQRYWVKSSLDENFRFRGAPRHVLLGSRSLDWNSQIAQWRNMMRLSEIPWLEDHRIGDKIVFPAAGTLVMAIEAIRQLLGNVSIRGIQIRDAVFSHAISICQGADTVETQLTLIKPSGPPTATSWAQYRLFAREEGSYIECASGWIRAMISQKDDCHTLSRGTWSLDGVDPHEWLKSIEAACRGCDRPPLDLPTRTEVRYGPAFQNLEWVRMGPEGEIVAGVDTESWKVRSTNSHAPSFVVHPTTLDGLAQCVGQALLAQRPNDLPTMVPVRISNIWVDCNSENLRYGTIEVVAKARFKGYKNCSANIVATTTALDGQREPLVYMEGLETSFIDETPGNAIQTTGNSAPRLCRSLVWKSDIELMSTEQLLAYCIRGRPPQSEDAATNYEALAVVVHCFIEEALQSLEQNPSLGTGERFGNYISWMRYQQRRLQSGQSVPQISNKSVQDLLGDPSARAALQDHIEQNTADGFLFIGVGRNLVRILNGKLDPLELFFRDDFADRSYDSMLANEHHVYPIRKFVELLCFKNPCMTILEVGAGTGGQTKGILDAMSQDGVKRWARYDFTDISPSFFSKSRAKFHDYAGKMAFRVLDVSLDPVEQKFEPESYDLIIASHVLHATNSLEISLRNIRTLLKPGGRLLLCETTRPESVPIGFPWGLLEGWWNPLNHETRAPHSPCVTVEQWHELFQKTGFTGVDVNIPGQAHPSCQYSSILMSTAKMQNTQTRLPAQVYLIAEPGIESQAKLATALAQRLTETMAVPTRTGTLAEVSGTIALADSSHAIFLLEVDAKFLDTISGSDYDNLQSVLIKSTNVLWLARSTAACIVEPGHHLAEGLGRALMSEDSTRKFAYVSLQDIGVDQDPTREVDVIHSIVQRMMEPASELLETSYKAISDGVKICRVSDHSALNTEIAQMALPHRLRQVRLESGIALSLRRLPGQFGHIGWVQDVGTEAADSGDLKHEEILVQVQAFGLNHQDQLVAEGHVNETRLGLECAGVVIEAGSDSGFRIGDRVCLISCSAAKSMIRVHGHSACKIPSDMTYTQAASLPVPQWIAYHSVVNLARVQKGDTVIIHDGSNSVGQLLIQMARNRGARVLVVTGSSEEASFVCEALSVAKVDVFVKDEHTSPQSLLQSALGMGSDVCINACFERKDDDETIAGLLSCLAPGGRFVDIRTQQSANVGLARAIEYKATNISYISVSLEHLIRERPVFAYKIFQEAMKTAFAERLQGPQPLHIISATDVRDTLTNFRDAETIGKRVVEFDWHGTLLAHVETKSAHKFPTDATYIISGGLGGLGRTMARWMVSRGAKNLVLLSRSGPKSGAAKALVQEFIQQNVRVETPAVDVGDIAKLKVTLESLDSVMPPVRGCIQAAMSLKNNLFENMTYRDWCEGVQSKATSTHNLHLALPHGLDFFVMLASVYGIFGGPGQANYSAASTFQDALAVHRVSLGQKAVSIDLGMMVEDGYVADNAEVLDRQRRFGQFVDIRREQLLALLDYYCDPGLPVLPPDQSQVLVGFRTAEAIRAQGIDVHHALFRPMFRELFLSEDGKDPHTKLPSSEVQGVASGNTTALALAPSDEEADTLVIQWSRSKIAQVLGVEVDEIDGSKPAHSYGVDSLVAIDLRQWFTKEVGADVHVFTLLGNKPLDDVAREAAKASQFRT